jgi:hypothetical protein
MASKTFAVVVTAPSGLTTRATYKSLRVARKEVGLCVEDYSDKDTARMMTASLQPGESIVVNGYTFAMKEV